MKLATLGSWEALAGNPGCRNHNRKASSILGASCRKAIDVAAQRQGAAVQRRQLEAEACEVEECATPKSYWVLLGDWRRQRAAGMDSGPDRRRRLVARIAAGGPGRSPCCEAHPGRTMPSNQTGSKRKVRRAGRGSARKRRSLIAVGTEQPDQAQVSETLPGADSTVMRRHQDL